MSVTAAEIRQMSRALGTPSSRKLAPLANTGAVSPEMLAMAAKLGLPSTLAKLLPESPSECTPICLEAIEGQPANYYLGTDANGVTGVWPIPGGVEEAPVDGIAYARRNATWFPMSVYFPAEPGPAEPNGLYAGVAKGITYAQLDDTLSYLKRLWIFNGVAGQTTGWI
jgi:hypothetical protein